MSQTPMLMERNKKKPETVGDILRFWRQLKKISQLDLALDVEISTKHLSFVETGRSHPSRNLVQKIAQSLRMPLRHQNALLKAAGYASVFGEEPLNSKKMEMVSEALLRILKKHEPYPAIVFNSSYKILLKNRGIDIILKLFFEEGLRQPYDNVYRLVFAADGLRQYIKDWPVIEHFLLSRLWEECVSTQNSELIALYKDISPSQKSKKPVEFQVDHNLPVLGFTLEKGPLKASFFTTVTTLGTPLDLTTQELRIESLFPADETTKKIFVQDETSV